MNVKKISLSILSSPIFDAFVILGLYYLYFGSAQNPINEFRLMQNGTVKMGVVDYIDGLDSNISHSPFLMHPYNYSFISPDGRWIKANQLILSSLKDQPVSAKPKFPAKITYLKSNPNISQFTSTISTSYSDFFFRRILLSFVFVSVIYFLLKFFIRTDYRESQKQKELQRLSLN